jgi:hypothetical protein
VTDRAVGRELTQWMKLFENLGDNFFRDSRCVGKDMCAQLRSDQDVDESIFRMPHAARLHKRRTPTATAQEQP